MRVGLDIEMWLFPCHFPAVTGKIEFTSFVLGRAKAPRTRLSLTFERAPFTLFTHIMRQARNRHDAVLMDNVGSIHCREPAFDRP
jgi:hypothetical protein